MITHIAPAYRTAQGITQSMLATFLSCRQKAKYKLNLWEPISENKAALERGNLFHLALENYYAVGNTYDQDVFISEVLETWKANLRKSGPANQEHIQESSNHFEILFPHYCHYWSKADQKLEWLALEKTFDVQWNGFRLRGKIDGIFKRDNRVWIFETKTKEQISELSLVDQLAFDLQNLFYMVAMKQLGYKPIAGVLYNVVRKTRIKNLDKYRLDVSKRPIHHFKRYEIIYTKRVQDSFESELLAKLTEYKQWSLGQIPNYKNETACVARGTCCPFLRACSTSSLAGYKQTGKLFRELTEVN